MTISRKRWAAKKLARSGVALASSLWQRLGRHGTSGAPRVRALTYHRFGASTRDPWCVSIARFEAQMRFVAEHGLALSLQDVLDFLAGRREVRDGSVLITMDDGYASVYSQAAPILQSLGVPAVAFVTTSLVGQQGDAERYMTWDEASRLPERGIDVGSHAHTHRSLGRMSRAEAVEEGSRSRELLERQLGREVRSFAYPYGMKPDHSQTTIEALTESGYDSIFISQHGVIDKSSNPLALPRVKVEGGEGLWMFRGQCQGAMDPWRLIDDLGRQW